MEYGSEGRYDNHFYIAEKWIILRYLPHACDTLHQFHEFTFRKTDFSLSLCEYVCVCTMHGCDCVCVFFLFQPLKKIFHISLTEVHVCVQFAICKCWPIFCCCLETAWVNCNFVSFTSSFCLHMSYRTIRDKNTMKLKSRNVLLEI